MQQGTMPPQPRRTLSSPDRTPSPEAKAPPKVTQVEGDQPQSRAQTRESALDELEATLSAYVARGPAAPVPHSHTGLPPHQLTAVPKPALNQPMAHVQGTAGVAWPLFADVEVLAPFRKGSTVSPTTQPAVPDTAITGAAPEQCPESVKRLSATLDSPGRLRVHSCNAAPAQMSVALASSYPGASPRQRAASAVAGTTDQAHTGPGVALASTAAALGELSAQLQGLMASEERMAARAQDVDLLFSVPPVAEAEPPKEETIANGGGTQAEFGASLAVSTPSHIGSPAKQSDLQRTSSAGQPSEGRVGASGTQDSLKHTGASAVPLELQGSLGTRLSETGKRSSEIAARLRELSSSMAALEAQPADTGHYAALTPQALRAFVYPEISETNVSDGVFPTFTRALDSHPPKCDLPPSACARDRVCGACVSIELTLAIEDRVVDR